MTFSVPERKINKLLASIVQVLQQNVTTAKDLSKIAGQLSSMHLSLGPIVRFMTRNTYREIESRHSCHSTFTPSEDCIHELKFWRKNIDAKNGYQIKQKEVVSEILFTDASSSAYGGFLLRKLGNVICHGVFSQDLVQSSSTERELAAVRNSLLSFKDYISHQCVSVRTDNFATSRIL